MAPYAVDQPLYEDAATYDGLRTPVGDLEHYQRLAIAQGGTVLELGCGTGRLTLGLAAAGVPIVGLDRAEAMLERARQKALGYPLQGNPRFLSGCMTDFSLGDRFDLISVPFNALQHLLSNDAVESCLDRVRRHLAPGGRLAFDVLNPDLRILLGEPEPYLVDRFRHPENGRLTEEWEHVAYDRTTQIARIRLTFSEPNPDGAPVIVREVVQTMRMFFPVELEALLRHAGWRIEQRWGDFQQGPFTSGSHRQVVLASPVVA